MSAKVHFAGGGRAYGIVLTSCNTFLAYGGSVITSAKADEVTCKRCRKAEGWQPLPTAHTGRPS